MAAAWTMKWFYGISGGRRVMDPRLQPEFLAQMTRRYGIATLIQIAAVGVAFAAPRIGVEIALLTVAWFLLPQPRPRYRSGQEPDEAEKEDV
jgi:hypothetical protein